MLGNLRRWYTQKKCSPEEIQELKRLWRAYNGSRAVFDKEALDAYLKNLAIEQKYIAINLLNVAQQKPEEVLLTFIGDYYDSYKRDHKKELEDIRKKIDRFTTAYVDQFSISNMDELEQYCLVVFIWYTQHNPDATDNFKETFYKDFVLSVVLQRRKFDPLRSDTLLTRQQLNQPNNDIKRLYDLAWNQSFEDYYKYRNNFDKIWGAKLGEHIKEVGECLENLELYTRKQMIYRAQSNYYVTVEYVVRALLHFLQTGSYNTPKNEIERHEKHLELIKRQREQVQTYSTKNSEAVDELRRQWSSFVDQNYSLANIDIPIVTTSYNSTAAQLKCLLRLVNIIDRIHT